MQAKAKEIKIDVCHTHKDLEWSKYYDGYAFAEQIMFPPRSCFVPECKREAYHTVIGVVIPNTVGDIQRKKSDPLCLGVYEIFNEAKSLLSGGNALDRTSYFLKTRIVPSKNRMFLAEKLTRHYAQLLLNKLKIDPTAPLSDKDKHRILQELSLYPADQEIS